MTFDVALNSPVTVTAIRLTREAASLGMAEHQRAKPRLLSLNSGTEQMRDMQAQLEKLRTQVVECEMIRDLATDPKKRELFNRLTEHHKVLVAEIERAIAESKG